ncbi:hypothetical protein [Burkholderia gladioli]|uniref:hypothetical protein n=1 Tax=Burkholderia gladioli TaxID=28095 RepID=UPI001640CC12|nr:hypothetical protein [Burkholderia gladioli]
MFATPARMPVVWVWAVHTQSTTNGGTMLFVQALAFFGQVSHEAPVLGAICLLALGIGIAAALYQLWPIAAGAFVVFLIFAVITLNSLSVPASSQNPTSSQQGASEYSDKYRPEKREEKLSVNYVDKLLTHA